MLSEPHADGVAIQYKWGGNGADSLDGPCKAPELAHLYLWVDESAVLPYGCGTYMYWLARRAGRDGRKEAGAC